MKIMILFLSLFESAKRLHKLRLRFKKSANLLGVDERFPVSPDNDDILINKIQNHYMDYKYLQYLENSEISILDKKKVAEKVLGQNVCPVNITHGGLFGDWEHEFETI
jgi:hypothetical protein